MTKMVAQTKERRKGSKREKSRLKSTVKRTKKAMTKIFWRDILNWSAMKVSWEFAAYSTFNSGFNQKNSGSQTARRWLPVQGPGFCALFEPFKRWEPVLFRGYS